MPPSPSPPEKSGNGEERPPKKFKANYLDIITVIAGKDEDKQQTFNVHKDLICDKSPFFTAACSTAWAEGQSRTVHLTEIEPETFKVYLNWIYTDAIDLGVVDIPLQADCAHKMAPAEVCTCQVMGRTFLLLKLYVAGDFISDSGVKDRAIDAYMQGRKQQMLTSTTSTLTYAWASTKDNSTLRRYLLDETIASITSEIF